jgi:AbrB family looped-hinge helix DNA binding protein
MGMIRVKSMKPMNRATCPGFFSESFYGTATVGERGQIVIPAEARNDMDMQPGEKLLIMRHPVHHGLVLFKLEAVREFLDEFTEGINRIENAREREGEEKGEAAE